MHPLLQRVLDEAVVPLRAGIGEIRADRQIARVAVEDPVREGLATGAALAAVDVQQVERARCAGLAERQLRQVAGAEAGARRVALELRVLDVDSDRRDVLCALHQARARRRLGADRDGVDPEELREHAFRRAVNLHPDRVVRAVAARGDGHVTRGDAAAVLVGVLEGERPRGRGVLGKFLRAGEGRGVGGGLG